MARAKRLQWTTPNGYQLLMFSIIMAQSHLRSRRKHKSTSGADHHLRHGSVGRALDYFSRVHRRPLCVSGCN